MSTSEDRNLNDRPDLQAFDRLEAAVEAALARVEALKKELGASQARSRELETLLRRFSGGGEDPATLATRLQDLEEENGVLIERLRKGRDGVQRLLARIRFLEEQG